MAYQPFTMAVSVLFWFFVITNVAGRGMLFPHPFINFSFDKEIYRAGDDAMGNCESTLTAASELTIEARGANVASNIEHRLHLEITGQHSVRFTVRNVTLQDRWFTCGRRNGLSSPETADEKKIIVGRAPLPIAAVPVSHVVLNWQEMETVFSPSLYEQNEYTHDANVTDSRVVPKVYITWSPSERTELRECTETIGMKCSVRRSTSPSGYLDMNAYNVRFNVTVKNCFGVETRLFVLPRKVKPGPTEFTASVESSTVVRIKLTVPNNKSLRYTLTFNATNLNHSKTVIKDRYVESALVTEVNVTDLVPNAQYNIAVTSIPAPVDTVGYPSDAVTRTVTMRQDVPALNPELLPAITTEEARDGQERDVTIYIQDVPPEYRHGDIVYFVSLKSATTGDTLQERVTVLNEHKFERLKNDEAYVVSVEARNTDPELGRNESLVPSHLIIAKQSEVRSTIGRVEPRLLDNLTFVDVRFNADKTPDQNLVVVFCETSIPMMKSCRGFPHAEPVVADSVSARINLPPNIKPFAYRVGLYRQPAPHANVTAISWSPCLYNITSVPKVTTAEIGACAVVDRSCFTLTAREYPCDDTGVYVTEYKVNYCHADDLNNCENRVFNMPAGQVLTENVVVSPGSYTVTVTPVSLGGLGPEIKQTVQVRSQSSGGDTNYWIIGVVFMFMGIVAVAALIYWYRAQNPKTQIHLPPVDERRNYNINDDTEPIYESIQDGLDVPERRYGKDSCTHVKDQRVPADDPSPGTSGSDCYALETFTPAFMTVISEIPSTRIGPPTAAIIHNQVASDDTSGQSCPDGHSDGSSQETSDSESTGGSCFPDYSDLRNNTIVIS